MTPRPTDVEEELQARAFLVAMRMLRGKRTIRSYRDAEAIAVGALSVCRHAVVGVPGVSAAPVKIARLEGTEDIWHDMHLDVPRGGARWKALEELPSEAALRRWAFGLFGIAVASVIAIVVVCLLRSRRRKWPYVSLGTLGVGASGAVVAACTGWDRLVVDLLAPVLRRIFGGSDG